MSKSSKNKMKMLAMMIVVMSLIARVGVTAYAAVIDRNKTGTLIIQPRYGGEDVSGGSFNIYYVADITNEASLTYELVFPFDQSGVDINKIKSASDVINATDILSGYISQVDDSAVITAAGGETVSNLELGIYLVVNTEIGGNYTVASSFLAFLPMFEDDEWLYSYAAYPKLGYDAPDPTPSPSPSPEPDGEGGGGDGGGTGTDAYFAPASVLAAVPVPTTMLRENITPASVPDIETVTVDDNETPFGVTAPETEVIETEENPLSAPQTGMLQWPVPLLGTLGCLLTGSGIMVGREKKKDEE